ncbi:MAG: sulfite exporter TauE/SafE family protein [Acidobacteria bacterium]|nr:sulfite exporter TauE/SafE family protein [Acidobacteriota bacterium]
MLIEIPVIFFFIAFVFSMLGMGGSQVYIPVLFWFGLDFKTAAIPLGMLLNVVNSSSAAVTYARKRLIDWRIGLLFGITMLIAAPIGTLANHFLSTKLLILFFALFTAVSGVLMWIGWQPKQPLTTKRRTVLGLAGGSGLGFLAGLIGRGGGSFVVPLLYMAGISAKTAAATSALAITFSGVSSFLSHLATAAKPDWPLWGGCVVAVFLGSQLGSHVMAAKLKSGAVKKIFAIVLLAIATILIVKDIILA